MSQQVIASTLDVSIDPTDVPLVAVRELATALKVLSSGPDALARAPFWSEEDFRRVEQYFWQRCSRDRQRKVAALVRLRSLIEVCRSRAVQALIAERGAEAMAGLIAAASGLRLNSAIGFSPMKILREARDAMRAEAAAGTALAA